ncbi:MAG: hypothetical protein ACI867_000150 [Glaciecola sp.]|jgi:hypothetical protein
MNRPKIITLFPPVAEICEDMVSRIRGPPGAIFPGSRASGPGQWRVPLHAGPVTREVDVHLGEVWLWGDGRWRSLTWEPCPVPHEFLPVERVLPSFVGELGLTTGNRSLVLTGSYHPPLGLVGTVVDTAALNAVARVTARQLLGDIALGLAQPTSV